MTRIALLIGLAACASSAPRAAAPANTPSTTAPMHADIPAWLQPFDACPADVMTINAPSIAGYPDRCVPGLDACLARCEQHDAVACYAAAADIQPTRPKLAEALFFRACTLGIASGCTNRAAAILVHERDAARTPTCTTRTFELACERQDPWACVMLSRALIDGRGTARDLDRAAAVLSAACRYGDDDPACQSAKDTEALIRAARAAAP